MKIKLSHKILFVVAIPIVFQFLYLWGLETPLDKLVQDQIREEKLTLSTILRDRLYVAASQRYLLVCLYGGTANHAYFDKFKANEAQNKESLQSLRELWDADSDKSRALQLYGRQDLIPRMKLGIMMMMQGGQKKEKFSDMFRSPFGGFGKFGNEGDGPSGSFGKERLQFILSHLGSNGQSALEQAFLPAETSADRELQDDQERLSRLLLFGLLASIMISIGAGLFFAWFFSSRLKVVIANIHSIESGKFIMTPAPRHGRSDEIGTLDSAIRDTATRIREAEEFQTRTIQIVAEELQRPLSIVSSSLEQLRNSGFESLTANGAVRLDGSSREISRLRMLVNELSLLDTVKSTDIALHIHEIDLAEIATTALEIVNDFARSKQVRLTSKIERVAVYGDPDRLLQVAVNLLSNAIKFTPKDSAVEIVTMPTAAGGRLEIIDEGPGIPIEFQSKLFGSFEQAQITDATEKNGSGLGLAISKKLLDKQNGEIGFTTKIGSGSTFWFALPNFSKPVEVEQVSASQRKKNSWKQPLWFKGLTLVALPIFVQLAAVATIWLVLNSINANTTGLVQARKIAQLHAQIITDMMRGRSNAVIFNISQDQSTKSAALAVHAEIKRLLGVIENVSGGSNDISAKTADLKKMIDENIKFENEIMEAEPDTKMDKWLDKEHVAQTENLALQTQGPLADIIVHEEELIQSRTIASQESRKLIGNLTALSAVLALLVSVSLSVFLARRLSSRAARVVRNAVRLTERQPLEKPLPGNDELAFVDQSFWTTAEKLMNMERFKQEMIAVTSHELRTPLSSLMALGEVISAGVFGTLTESGTEALNTAQENITELISMITNLLDLEKMQSGKNLVNKELYDIDLGLVDAASALRNLTRNLDIQLKIEFSGIEALVDPRRLTQALTAILREMIEQLPKQSVVTLEGQNYHSGIELKITAPTVRSTSGSSLSDEHPARQQLALQLSKLIAEQHGGEMIVRMRKDFRAVCFRLPQDLVQA